MTAPEILEKLEATFRQEGVGFEVLGQEGERLLVRARRHAPGAPVAFLVKALEGTLKRYHDTLREVELVEYDPGEGSATPAEPSSNFAPVTGHRSTGSFAMPEEPGLDLRGSSRAEAVRALEAAHKLWSRQGVKRFRVRGLEEDAVRRAAAKWASFYEMDAVAGADDTLRVRLAEAAPEAAAADDEILWFPARLMLVSGEPDGQDVG